MERNAFQKMLRNEVTWVIFVIVSFWGFVTTVVLPLQKLQIQVAQIQTDLNKQGKTYQTLSDDVNLLKTDVAVLKVSKKI